MLTMPGALVATFELLKARAPPTEFVREGLMPNTLLKAATMRTRLRMLSSPSQKNARDHSCMPYET